ncbi:MAG: PEGA domain-containing protein [Bradymonadaceae bacterium]|nr:PEGA domain-containing protein [Lujinxingiaceae bacterium]
MVQAHTQIVRSSRLLAVFFLAAGLLFGAPAFAQTKDNSAEQVLTLVRSANDAFDAKDYSKAYDLYLQANTIRPEPVILFRLAQTAEELQRPRAAIEHYEAFVALESKGDAAKRARTRITALRATLPALVRIDSTPQGASVFLGSSESKPLGKTPVEIDVEAGEATFVVTFPSHEPATKTVMLRAGTEQALSFELLEADPVEGDEADLITRSPEQGDAVDSPIPFVAEKTKVVPPPAEESSTLATWGWVTVGTGVAVLAAGGAFSILQMSATEDVNSYNKRATGASPAGIDQLKDDANGYHTMALVSYIAGGVIAAAGVGILAYDAMNRGDDTAASVQGPSFKLDVGVVRSGGWLGVNGRF